MNAQNLTITIFSVNHPNVPPTGGHLRITHWNSKERAWRGLKFGGLCLGLAVASIPIPVLHFFLVPGFLLAAPVVLFFVIRKEREIEGGDVLCPHCQKSFHVARASYRFPFFEFCSNCQQRVRIEMTTQQ